MMQDMKNPKKTKAEMKKDMETAPGNGGDDYPWGLRMSVEKPQLDKLPSLSKAKVGDMVKMEAMCKVTGKRSNERDGKEESTVELQVCQMDCKGDAQEDFDDEFEKTAGGKMGGKTGMKMPM